MPVAAGSLADGLKRPGPFRDEYIVEIMRDVCTGLAYIHGQGVLHRDLKPDNIPRTPGGAWAIADFGLAREVVESARLTRTGRGLGTPMYMAPEQWGDASRVTAAADVYAAGKVVQEMMAGMPPTTSDVPPGLLAPVVRRAILPDPALRYQSAGELLAALQVAVTPGYWEPAAQKAGRLRAQLAAGPDAGAIGEVTRWAGEAGAEDLRDLTVAISALSAWAAGDWWKENPVSFSRTFTQFARGMRECEFQFADCDTAAEPVAFGSHRKPEAIILPYEVYERYEALARQRERLDWVLSAARSVQVELPGAFGPEHDEEVSAYVDGEIDAAELYRRTVERYRKP